MVPPADRPTVVRPGQVARFHHVARIPADAVPGTAQLQGTVRYDYRGGTANLPVTASPTIQAPVTVASVTVSAAKAQPGDALTASVKLTNRATVGFKRNLTIETPAGWSAPATLSHDIAPGATVTVPVKIDVPLAITQGAATIVATVGALPEERGSTTTTVELATPPDNAADHVDLGNTASETAHALAASPSSGVNVEAGLTRRYTGNSASDGWFEMDLNVPAGQAFVIRAIETYHVAQLKTYDVTLDGKLASQRRFQRTESASGTVTYQFVVQPSADTADGKVRIRFRDVPGDYDPSIADIWVVPLT